MAGRGWADDVGGGFYDATMSKNAVVAAFLLSVLLLAGCSSSPGATSSDGADAGASTPSEQASEPAPEPLDLTGDWKQSNSDSADSYQQATITADTISVDWVNAAESTTAIYWIGTYTAPDEATDSFTWESKGDTEKMSHALLASQDDTKTFTYKDGVLSYKVTALGVTKTVEMKRE